MIRCHWVGIGGSWDERKREARCATRSHGDSRERNCFLSVRLVRRLQ